MKLTDIQLEMVRYFQIEHYGAPRKDEHHDRSWNELYHSGKTNHEVIYDNLVEGFSFISRKSLLLQRMNKILMFTGTVGTVVGWVLFAWWGVGIVLVTLGVVNFVIGAWVSISVRKHTMWTDEIMRAALDLVAEPSWQIEMRR